MVHALASYCLWYFTYHGSSLHDSFSYDYEQLYTQVIIFCQICKCAKLQMDVNRLTPLCSNSPLSDLCSLLNRPTDLLQVNNRARKEKCSVIPFRQGIKNQKKC